MIKGIHGLFAQRPSCFCFCICLFVSPRGGQGSVWESVDEGGDGSGVVGGAGKGHRGEGKQSLENYQYINISKYLSRYFIYIKHGHRSEGKQSLREKSIFLSHRNSSKSTKDKEDQKITEGKTCLLLKSFSIILNRKISSLPKRKKPFLTVVSFFSSFPCQFYVSPRFQEVRG